MKTILANVIRKFSVGRLRIEPAFHRVFELRPFARPFVHLPRANGTEIDYPPFF